MSAISKMVSIVPNFTYLYFSLLCVSYQISLKGRLKKFAWDAVYELVMLSLSNQTFFTVLLFNTLWKILCKKVMVAGARHHHHHFWGWKIAWDAVYAKNSTLFLSLILHALKSEFGSTLVIWKSGIIVKIEK